MNKKLIRLTESDLHRIVKESVNRVLKEAANDSLTDGAIEYQGSPNYDKFIRKRAEWMKNSDPNSRKRGEDFGLTGNMKNKNHSNRMTRYDEWDGISSHGEPMISNISTKIYSSLMDVNDVINSVFDSKMNLGNNEYNFLNDLQTEIEGLLNRTKKFENGEN
jgi:hypothetical protein